MKKPNLFIVGEPKSGTTALYHFLKQHPDIYMAHYKEPHYFCTDFHKESDEFHKKQKYFNTRTEQQFLALFSDWKKEKIAGEASPSYLYSKVAAGNIYKFNPKAKIIIMLREPVEFLYSWHSEIKNELDETILDFEEALASEKERKRGKHIPKTVKHPSKLFYSERIKYCEQIKRFLKFFNRNQIKIIVYDDFREDNAKAYKDVLKFLNVDPNFVPNFKIHNPNEAIRSMMIFKLRGILRYTWKALKLIYPPVAKHNDKVFSLYKKIFFKAQPRHALNPELRKKLMKKFKPEVIKLSKLLNRDMVKLWGYDRI